METATTKAANAAMQANNDTLIRTRNLKTYFYLRSGVVHAVDDVSFEIRRGKVLGLVGESGCGKSVTALSILNLLPRRITRIQGAIDYFPPNGDPVNLVELNPKGDHIRAIRGSHISMIFQEPMTSLNPVYAVGDQISESLILHKKITPEDARKQSIEMLDKVGIPSPERRADDYPHQLSGGMRQRVMIAMALSCNPSLLIADEPTTALDVTIQLQIMELMEQMQSEFGSGILMITHNLGVIAGIADSVAVMYLGQIVEYADTKELFKNPLHPYTQGLLKSIPVLGRRAKNRLQPIQGVVPSPFAIPAGCRFRSRCTKVTKDCVHPIDIREPAKGHQVRCLLYGDRA
jgi:peptide/nickel transport system ATP-binding protein